MSKENILLKLLQQVANRIPVDNRAVAINVKTVEVLLTKDHKKELEEHINTNLRQTGEITSAFLKRAITLFVTEKLTASESMGEEPSIFQSLMEILKDRQTFEAREKSLIISIRSQ